MVLLLNSAVMPTEGVYTLKRISKSKFQELLQEAAATGDLQSYIGYPKTADLIEQLTGIEIDVSREQAELTTGDVMLIVKLRHRIQDLSDISTYQPSIADLDFFVCYWQPLAEGKEANENICDISR
jgi:hypothetical protein